MTVPRGTNAATTINEIDYSAHAIDQMQERGIPPSVVQNAIQNGVVYPIREGTIGYYDSVNNVRVITSGSTGNVVTVIPGAPKKISRSNNSLEVDVRNILLQDWDPIGVGDMPEAQDEYDLYVEDICKLLRAGQTSSNVYGFLRWIEIERMGLDGNESLTQQIAKKLVALLQ